MDTLLKKIDELSTKVNDLTTRLSVMEKRFDPVGGNLEEIIREAVFFDVDNATSTTTTATASLVNGHVTVPTTPAKFIRGYFRGKAYNFAVYTIP